RRFGLDAAAGIAVIVADGAAAQIHRRGPDTAGAAARGIAADAAAAEIHLEGEDAAVVFSQVAPDRAVADVEHTPLTLGIRVDPQAATLVPGDVVVDEAADQRDVARPRQRGVGDAAAVPGGAVAGDGAVLHHQVGVAHPDAASTRVIRQAVADRQALEGDV